MGYAGAKKCVAVFVLIKNVVWVWEGQSKVDFVGRKSRTATWFIALQYVAPQQVMLHHIVMVVMGGLVVEDI